MAIGGAGRRKRGPKFILPILNDTKPLRKPVVIRVDHEVYDLMLRRARPLIDTPNSVLRRILGLPFKPNARTHRKQEWK